jgi:hypothetical protein
MAALRAAIEQRLATITALPAEARDAAVDQLRAAAGAGASLLRSLSPLLTVLLEAPVLDAGSRHEQFAGAVASFLAALPGQAGGMVVPCCLMSIGPRRPLRCLIQKGPSKRCR